MCDVLFILLDSVSAVLCPMAFTDVVSWILGYWSSSVSFLVQSNYNKKQKQRRKRERRKGKKECKFHNFSSRR